jgi:SnoaL-like protein
VTCVDGYSADREAIIAVLDAMAAILDGRAWDRLGEVFTPDAVAYRGQNRGLAAIERGIRDQLGGCGPSQHLLGNYQVTVDGDRAVSVTKVRVMHQGAGDRSHLTYECLGNYHDEHVRTVDGWRISRRRLDVTMQFGDRSVLGPG